MKELIQEAKKRISEIAEKSKLEQPESYLAIYESENGYTVSWIRRGDETRTPGISFGGKELTKKEVENVINEFEGIISQYYGH